MQAEAQSLNRIFPREWSLAPHFLGAVVVDEPPGGRRRIASFAG